MINIKKAQIAYKKYTEKYANLETVGIDKIEMKIEHIKRVSEIAKNIAKNLKLSEEDILLAELIGLLHDIGRFEQIRIYNTGVDKDSVNHGELGVQILFEENLIREFIEESKYDDIIKTSILSHNKNKSEIIESKNEKINLHTKIIRDADKVDILYILTFEEKLTAWESENIDNEEIAKEIFRGFIENREVDYTKMKAHVDILIGQFAYIFDINFKYTMKYIKEKEYYNKIYKRFNFTNKDTKNKMEEIYDIVEKYMKNEINK